MLDTSESFSVYIGNDITKYITIDEDYSHYLDIEKLEKIIEDNPNKRILVGAKEDWYFTATDINLDKLKEYKEKGKAHILVASSWDILVVKIEDNEGNLIEEIDCTINIKKYHSQLAFAAGYYSAMSRINGWFDKSLYHDCLRKWKYEVGKDFAKEVNALIEKYESIHQNLEKYKEDNS